MKRIAVFGAGLVGTYAGARLAPHAAVTLIGRPALVEAAAAGLRVSDIEGFDLALAPGTLAATTDPAGLGEADLVLVTVKSLATEEAARAIAAHAPPAAIIVSLQNGVSNAGTLRAALPGRTVLAGMVPFNVAARAPGHVHRGTGDGKIVVEAHAALEPFLPLFAAAGLPVEPAADILAVQWGKLLINLNNAVNALAGVTLMEQLRQRGFRRAWAMTLAEALGILKRAGIRPVDTLPMPLELLPAIMSLPNRLYFFIVAQSGGGRARVDPHARSSMADDLARGRPTEVDYLNGEVVRLADRLGMKAPLNARMVELVHAAEAGAPPWSAGALVAELLRARRASARR
ncbi:2-dehydropantoate 2-reductase [Thermaurantiacus sp.]